LKKLNAKVSDAIGDNSLARVSLNPSDFNPRFKPPQPANNSI
jgi:hypothetical protein